MGKRNRDVNIRKEQFDELLLAANSKHLAVDPENENVILKRCIILFDKFPTSVAIKFALCLASGR